MSEWKGLWPSTWGSASAWQLAVSSVAICGCLTLCLWLCVSELLSDRLVDRRREDLLLAVRRLLMPRSFRLALHFLHSILYGPIQINSLKPWAAGLAQISAAAPLYHLTFVTNSHWPFLRHPRPHPVLSHHVPVWFSPCPLAESQALSSPRWLSGDKRGQHC